MTWLFTQVWLWSLAAFVFGALISWLLFVFPLRRRFRALADEYAGYVAEVEERFEEQQRHEPEPEDSAMALLPTEGDARSGADAPAEVGDRVGAGAPREVDPEEPTFGDWHRAPRAWMPSSGGAETTGATDTGGPQPSSQSESTAVDQAPETFDRRETASIPADETELRMEEQRESTERHATFRVTPIVPRPSAPAELSFGSSEPTAPAAPAQAQPENRDGWSSWFEKGVSDGPEESFSWATAFDPPEPVAESRSAGTEPAGVVPPSGVVPPEPVAPEPARTGPEPTGDGPRPAGSDSDATASRGESPETGQEATGRVRPLFQPRNTPASRSSAAATQHATGEQGAGEEEPGAEAELDSSAFGDASAGTPGDMSPGEPSAGTPGEPSTGTPGEPSTGASGSERAGEDGVLPRRTPGHGPRPGRQNLNRLRKEAEAAGDEHSEPARPAGAPRDVGIPAGADSPETVQGADRADREGKMVKGHFASRQYHTPDSPQYDRVVAEVWFRSAADAEQAGFEPWHGNQNLNAH